MSSYTPERVDNVLVVVRSSYERTEAVCAQLAKQQVPAEHIQIIHERPFSLALKKSFELGIDSGLDWTFCLDADIMLRRDAIHTYKQWMETQPDRAFSCGAMLTDKLLGIPRSGTNFYRNSALPLALNYIDDSTNNIKPESFVRLKVLEHGYTFSTIENTVVGLHDYEQYYRDVYRKAIVFSEKNRKRPYLLDFWERCASQDIDYRIAIWGYRLGQIYDGQIVIDIKQFPQQIDMLLEQIDAREKPSLDITEWNFDKIEKMIESATPPPEYLEWKRVQAIQQGPMGNFRCASDRYGTIGGVLWLAGKKLQNIGWTLEHNTTKGVEI